MRVRIAPRFSEHLDDAVLRDLAEERADTRRGTANTESRSGPAVDRRARPIAAAIIQKPAQENERWQQGRRPARRRVAMVKPGGICAFAPWTVGAIPTGRVTP